MGDSGGYCLRLQGYGELSEKERGYYSYAARFTPFLNALLIAAGLITQSYLLFAVLSLTLLVGALFPGFSVFDALLLNGLISPLLKFKKLPPTPPPRRFAMGLAFLFSLGTAGSIYYGQAAAAYALGGVLFLASLLIVLTNWCLGSWIYGKTMRLLRAPGKTGKVS